jgi:predicted transglutaminase-like cysteine proteinase
MGFWKTKVFAAAVIQCVISSSAHASSSTSQLDYFFGKSESIFVESSKLTMGPLGHAVLCAKTKISCETSKSKDAQQFVSDQQHNLLVKVNLAINHSMKPRRDSLREGFGDTWTIGGKFGDCEDYALTKLNAMVQEGLPESAFRIAIVKTQTGEGHALLVARTSEGDMVLDNLSPKIIAWNTTNYNWLMIQSTTNKHQWLSIDTKTASKPIPVS